jgi:site-specific recombinase XerC
VELFNYLLNLYFEQGKQIADEQIIYRLAQEGLTGTTPGRRKSTVRNWLNWIIQNLPSE